jgi:5-formaminoimidazole-4-carboxamide-1-(beta)-D-ribofuranosyl 5'-monophosphate synthetase
MTGEKMHHKICTLGSHSALQILKGAHDEGFGTIAICRKGNVQPYESYRVADEIIEVESFAELKNLDAQLARQDAILIPHGSLVQAVDMDDVHKLQTLYFGNKHILPWETDRAKQREWLQMAGLKLPRIYEKPEDIDGPVIIKFFGAEGGRGYFLAHNLEEFKRSRRANVHSLFLFAAD